MDPSSVPKKTPKGIEEIETRKHKLAPRLRSLLIVVNGKITAAQIAKQFETLGDVSQLLDELAGQGFIAAEGASGAPASGAPSGSAPPADGAKFQAARAQIARLLIDALGPNADVLTEKIDRCRSVEELRSYLEGSRQSITAMLGKANSDRFWARASTLLA